VLVVVSLNESLSIEVICNYELDGFAVYDCVVVVVDMVG
jgi:hypothetical protein